MFKNNIDKKIVKYGIKKLSLGIVSVAIGTLVFLGGTASAHDENSSNKNDVTVHEKPKNLEITSETINNLENKITNVSNNISNNNSIPTVSENNIENIFIFYIIFRVDTFRSCAKNFFSSWNI